MKELKTGLYNYRTTISGLFALLANAMATALPEYAGVFEQLSNAGIAAFVIFVKDASTGSSPPRIAVGKKEACPTCGK
jgi:hypothetical protein